MVRQKVNWKVYTTAAIITIFVFSIGIGIGYMISNEKYNIMYYDMENLKVQQRDMEVESMLINSLGSNTCSNLNYEIEKTATQSTSLGEKLSYYNNEIMRNPDFLILKKNYIISLIQFWSYWEMFKKNCNSSVNTVLYFYSIKDCNECQAQGFVLSFLKEKYPSDIMVFAMDKDEDLYSLNLIKDTYNVTKAPTLVINNQKYEGLSDINELKSLLVL
jgi:glutaredoxin